MKQIIKSHGKLVKEGSIPLYDKNLDKKKHIFLDLMFKETTIFTGVMKINMMCSHAKDEHQCLSHM